MPACPSLPKSGPLPWRRRPLRAPGCLAARRTRPRACPTSPSSPTPPSSLAVPPRWIPASEAGRTGAGTRAERALWRRGGGRSAAAPFARQQPALPTTTTRAKQKKRKKKAKNVFRSLIWEATLNLSHLRRTVAHKRKTIEKWERNASGSGSVFFFDGVSSSRSHSNRCRGGDAVRGRWWRRGARATGRMVGAARWRRRW